MKKLIQFLLIATLLLFVIINNTFIQGASSRELTLTSQDLGREYTYSGIVAWQGLTYDKKGRPNAILFSLEEYEGLYFQIALSDADSLGIITEHRTRIFIGSKVEFNCREKRAETTNIYLLTSFKWIAKKIVQEGKLHFDGIVEKLTLILDSDNDWQSCLKLVDRPNFVFLLQKGTFKNSVVKWLGIFDEKGTIKIDVGYHISLTCDKTQDSCKFIVTSLGCIDIPKRIALIIGNDSYQPSPLEYPVRDANAVTRALKNAEFTVYNYSNLNLKEMKRAITEFGALISPGGAALFYYSGHGMQINGLNYLIPIGASIAKEQDVDIEGVRVDQVLEVMKVAKSRINIVVLDACRVNPYQQSFQSTLLGLAAMTAPAGTIISFSAPPGKVASEGTGLLSTFTEEFVRNLYKRGLKIEEVFDETRSAVFNNTFGNTGLIQFPWVSSSFEGVFYFVDDTDTPLSIKEKEPWQKAQTEPRITESYTDDFGIHWIFVEGGPGGDYFISATEVTFDQYDEFCEATEHGILFLPNVVRGNQPVILVTVADAVAYCKWLSKETGTIVRLPEENEWEFAAKGGNKSKGFTYSGSNTIEEVAWYKGNSGNKTHEVATKKPNELGIYDMSGNVWEWCGTLGEIRGGCFANEDSSCRVSYISRAGLFPNIASCWFGFRLLQKR